MEKNKNPIIMGFFHQTNSIFSSSNSPRFIKPLVMAIHVHKYPKWDKIMKRR
jgi:hypothetical protein